jgi:hypothetical protein
LEGKRSGNVGGKEERRVKEKSNAPDQATDAVPDVRCAERSDLLRVSSCSGKKSQLERGKGNETKTHRY